jgi:hypothetical protein
VTVSPLTPPIQPQPQVKEWIELFDKGVISREELRHQLALATANAISSPTLDDSPATKPGESPALSSKQKRPRETQALLLSSDQTSSCSIQEGDRSIEN